jgi:hypothetical protein
LVGVVFALGLGVGVTAGALHGTFDANPKVDAVGVTLPVITTRYRLQPPSSAHDPDAAQ